MECGQKETVINMDDMVDTNDISLLNRLTEEIIDATYVGLRKQSTLNLDRSSLGLDIDAGTPWHRRDNSHKV